MVFVISTQYLEDKYNSYYHRSDTQREEGLADACCFKSARKSGVF